MFIAQLDQFGIRFSMRVNLVALQEGSDESERVFWVVWPSLNQRCEHVEALSYGSRGDEVFLKTFHARANLLECVHGEYVSAGVATTWLLSFWLRPA